MQCKVLRGLQIGLDFVTEVTENVNLNKVP